VILFDVMDTLVVDPFHEAIPAYFGLTLAEFLEQKHPTAWVQFERGELDPKEYAERMFADGRAVDWGSFEAHVRAAYVWVEGMRELLEHLARAGAEMHALSNYPVLYRSVDAALGISRLVQLSFVSCITGHRKPDSRAYLHAADRVGRAPADCLFVDDRASNCRAARAVGMRALEFEDATSLRSALETMGIL
jgi:HAD superfamily hydrolase (TIGR01509 family)